MKSFLSLVFLLAGCVQVLRAGEGLQTVEDAELKKLVQEEQYVLALFCTQSNQEKCEEFEDELAGIREDLIDMLGDGWVVKLTDSAMLPRFAPSADQPVIVFFRQRVPVLYDGPANGEVMAETLVQYKEHGVKELTDSTFEHLTQAATGATTGDWLVLFYTDECERCKDLEATLETIACRHRGRINVARVNKQTYGEKTGRRFELGLESAPQFIFFRLGRMYRYSLDKTDAASLSSFVTGFYKNYPAESIPVPKTPFDDLVQMCVDYMKEYPLLVGAGVLLPILLILAFLWLIRSDDPKVKKSKKKKNKDKESTTNGGAVSSNGSTKKEAKKEK